MRAAVAVISGILALASPVLADSLDAILGRMDKAAPAFHQMTANISKIEYTAIINDTSVESGSVWIRRAGRDMEMRTEITRPEPRMAGLHDETAEVYYPKINTVQIYNLGKMRGLVDQFLLLGFGTTGKELLANYEIKPGGETTVEGRPATRIDMVPKSRKVLENFKLIQMWIPNDSAYPIRIRMVQPSGNYYEVTYSNLKLNPNLPASDFRLHLPANVHKEYPQK
jgi:outer membrane lipoprotein-sorting protein